MLSNPYFRVYTQDDIIGVEVGGSLKNIYAIGAGIIEGYGLGFNTKTALISRAIREMQKFVFLFGGKIETCFGLAGYGDLILTAYGESSRNRTCGYKLAQGCKSVDIL